MRLPILLSLSALLLAFPLAAQEVLVQWQFDQAGDTEGWLPAHSLAPFVVEGGILRTQVTAGDPYMHASSGHGFDIEGSDFQYIEIRMKHDAGTLAEFFWANQIEGKDAGFVPGKERGFTCVPDGQWHVYHVYPLWRGKVTRLRLDPPSDVDDPAEIQIDYIRIMQAPASKHDPRSPQWDLIEDNAGWVAVSGGSHLSPSGDGAQTTLLNERVLLTGPVVDLKSDEFKYAFIELTATAPLVGDLLWSATEDGNFAASNLVSFEAPGGASTTNVALSPAPMYRGDIKRLQLLLRAEPGTSITLKRVALSPTPIGPARLRLISFAPTDAVGTVGRRGAVVAKVENNGGESLDGEALTVEVIDGRAQIVGPRKRPVGSLDPGATASIIWPFVCGGEGRARFALTAPGLQRAETDVIVSRRFPTPKPDGVPHARAGAGGAWIGNDKVLLTIAKSANGFAGGRLAAVSEGKAQVMAALPQLACLAVAGEERFVNLLAQDADVIEDENRATLTLNGTTRVGDAQVTLAIAFTLAKGASYIDAAYELSADKDLRMTAFRGPWLWAGEGAFGDRQDIALFPGSEYMIAGERSSSVLDIAPPANTRFAPHPNTVTVPSMAIEKDGAIVGLMWDPLQKWDGEHQKPTAVFASPNFVEGYANHLMGLCLPAIPEWMNANELVAETPYELRAGKALTLTASLYAEADSEVLRSMDLYFDRFGIPELPPKPRSYEDTVAMSLKAYEEVLWVEEARGWMGVIGWSPHRNQSVALNYLLASRLLDDEQWAAELAKKGLSLGDPSGLAFALHEFGAPSNSASLIVADGRMSARRVPEDGKYTFKPDAKRMCLGQVGETASGICARGVRPLLRSALRTGDDEPLEAALKTLKLMERFKIPRASQVWEVPVHTPDILASADCCEVYLLAYRLTGDRELLKRAVYWARTGLPFVYMWQAPDQRDLMKGGSIAVFGATYYTCNWFARPVQWNGLEYARVLLDLARYDKSLPWRRFAEMITISGMNQQTTREKDCGAYTDNWDVIRDVECTGCMLSPGRIMTNAMELMGRPSGIRTEVVRVGDRRICITSAPRISRLRMADSILQFSLEYDEGLTAYTVVMPIAEPAQIEVDGAELPKRGTPIDLQEGWSYAQDTGCLTLKLKYAKGLRNVRLIKATPVVSELPTPGWEFSVAGDTEGWTPAHDVAPLEVRDGRLIVEVTGGDPYISGPRMLVDASQCRGIIIRARVTRPDGTLFFANENGNYAPERSRTFSLPADGEFHEIEIDLSDHEEWTGVIYQIRLDFAGPPCTAQIEWVRVIEKAGTN